jgi:hypothetical protein
VAVNPEDGRIPADPMLEGNPVEVTAFNSAGGVGNANAANDVVCGLGAGGTVGCSIIAAPAAATNPALVAATANRLDNRFIFFPPPMVIPKLLSNPSSPRSGRH